MTQERGTADWIERESGTYTQKTADFIIQEVCYMTLTKVCRTYKDLPSRPTIYHWLKTFPEFKKRYQESVQIRIHALMDGMEDLSDDVTEKNAHASKVKAGINEFVIVKQLPTKYGDQKFVTQRNINEVEEKPRVSLEDLRDIPQDIRDALRAIADMASANPPMKSIEKKDDIVDVPYVEIKKDPE